MVTLNLPGTAVGALPMVNKLTYSSVPPDCNYLNFTREESKSQDMIIVS